MSAHTQRTMCTALTGGVHGDGIWQGLPKVCGTPATGPHPDPAIGYLRPLCAGHAAEAAALLTELLSAEADPQQVCPTCTYGVVLGIDDEIPCPDCGGAFLNAPPLPVPDFACPGERTCRVCPEHQYSEPQDQR